MKETEANIEQFGKMWGRVLSTLPPCVFEGAIIPTSVSMMTHGLLPAWISEAETLWATVSQQRASSEMVVDEDALLGMSLAKMPDIPVSALLACMTHVAVNQVSPDRELRLEKLIERFQTSRGLSMPVGLGPSHPNRRI